jgi:uncharacterized protein YjbJ (UPF0337 family)
MWAPALCANRQNVSAFICIYDIERSGIERRVQIDSMGHEQESIMNRDQTRGRIEEAKGKAHETIGKVKGDKNLENRGKIQKDLGKAQAAYGNLQANIKKAKTPR